MKHIIHIADIIYIKYINKIYNAKNGKISEVILDNINSRLIEQLKVNQWKKMQNVIDWFIKIEGKPITSL